METARFGKGRMRQSELNRVAPRGLGRRDVLRLGLSTAGIWVVGGALSGCGSDYVASRTNPEPERRSNIANLGPLGEPNADGVRLPAGFTARIVARSGQFPLASADYQWHSATDGGATFPTADGGWIYVSNSEMPSIGPISGGVGALRFTADGTIAGAYPILQGTQINCAGGPTPWGTWLSCEEYDEGRVWECDPHGINAAVAHPALGVFVHEAVTFDTVRKHVYLTEDRPDGRFYRFTPDRLGPDGQPDLSSGKLEFAQVVSGEEGALRWLEVPDPTAASAPTRMQVPESTAFDRGEGIWYHESIVYFSTKGDNRVWALDTRNDTITVFYDDNRYPEPVLRGVDNIVISAGGDVLVADEGDNMQIVALTPGGTILPIVQIEGQSRSEITGPAFNPAGDRLYFSSQRGPTNNPTRGITYEVSGPFFS
jgi:secreted PhoX family phosphatase